MLGNAMRIIFWRIVDDRVKKRRELRKTGTRWLGGRNNVSHIGEVRKCLCYLKEKRVQKREKPFMGGGQVQQGILKQRSPMGLGHRFPTVITLFQVGKEGVGGRGGKRFSRKPLGGLKAHNPPSVSRKKKNGGVKNGDQNSKIFRDA